MADEPARGDHDLERDDEDHDLLTFSEGGIRLREEIEATEAALAEAAPGDGAADLLRTRLTALNEALERNTRQSSEHPGEAGFLSYVPRRPLPPGADADAEERA